jgi:hypothetical protein
LPQVELRRGNLDTMWGFSVEAELVENSEKQVRFLSMSLMSKNANVKLRKISKNYRLSLFNSSGHHYWL